MLAVLRPIETILTARQGCDSWNLHLDKLCFDTEAGAEGKNDALRRVADSWRSKSSPHLKDACERKLLWLDRLSAQNGDRFRRVSLVNESRLLLHLGRANVLENVGLYADRTTGLPLIPGTALKGVLSTWASWEANLNDDTGFNEPASFLSQRSQFKSPDASAVFGDDSKKGSNHSGDVIFVGGFPAEPQKLPRLEPDIVTPHPDDGRGRILPNAFLAWTPDAVWHFVFLARPGADGGTKLLDQTVNWLIEALSSTGIGAKTAAGYGRFRTLNDEEQRRIQQQDDARLDALRQRQADQEAKAQRDKLPPEERAFVEYVASQKDWVAAAREVAKRPEQERQQILRYFRSEGGQALLKTWTNDKGKKRIEALKAAGL